MPAQLVDRGVAKRAIEPGHHPLFSWKVLQTTYDLRECVLEDVFRKLPIADSTLEIPEECPVVVEQYGERGRSLVGKRAALGHHQQYRCRRGETGRARSPYVLTNCNEPLAAA